MTTARSAVPRRTLFSASTTSPRARALLRFLRNGTGRTGLSIVLGMILLSLAAPALAPFPEDAIGAGRAHLEERLLGPSSAHWFGTDQLGRDVLSRALFGGQVSLFIGFASMAFAALIGTTLGLVSGYAGHWVDEVIMRIADVFLGIPPLVLAVLVALTLGGGVEMTVVAIAATNWPKTARLIRGEVLRIKILEYVEAAFAYGARPTRIVLRHVFPAAIPALIAQASLLVGYGILVAATLGFIGLGAQPPSPEWGLSIAIGREFLPESWWVSFFPGLMILLTVTGLNLLGDGLREALDARTDQGI
jgi:peptide/nickel transport system permease protein